MRNRNALLAATLLAGIAGAAVAQDASNSAATYDPNQLPAIQGKVAEYSLTPRGDVDGLILADGTEIHLPPRLGTQLVYAVKPGDAVTITQGSINLGSLIGTYIFGSTGKTASGDKKATGGIAPLK